MKKITEVTRQDILDIVRDGFEIKFENPVFDSETGQYLSSKPIKMWFAGRVKIIPFLSRATPHKCQKPHYTVGAK